MTPPHGPTPLALDGRSLDTLRLQARDSPNAALQEAARQFEVLFMNMLLKSMREAVPQDGVFDSEQTRFYTSMLDAQLAQAMSRRGVGLAEIMARQLGRNIDQTSAGAAAAPQPAPQAPAPPPAPQSQSLPLPSGQTRDFVNRLWPHAVDASRVTGIPAHFILGQAALESGWGGREIRAADGTTSYNLFGIKAGRGWTGPTVETGTTEYVQGVARRSVERFRAYSSYEEAFQDYARLLRGNPRYARVLESGGDAAAFARGLQEAGYATDPAYADKLERVITGNLLRSGLAG